MSIQLAPKLPLSYSEGVGPYTPITDYLSLVKQNMKMVLLTSPGERVMIPEYGVGLKRFLFLQNTETTLDNMRERIAEQIQTYLPYVVIQDLRVTSGAELGSSLQDNYVNVFIKYYIQGVDQIDSISINGELYNNTNNISLR